MGNKVVQFVCKRDLPNGAVKDMTVSVCLRNGIGTNDPRAFKEAQRQFQQRGIYMSNADIRNNTVRRK